MGTVILYGSHAADSYVWYAENILKRKILMTALAATLRNPSRMWTKHSTRETVPIENMDTNWLRNSINMVNRGHDIRGRRIGEEQTNKLAWLVEELSYRDETEGWDE